jgi:hypothetical protein
MEEMKSAIFPGWSMLIMLSALLGNRGLFSEICFISLMRARVRGIDLAGVVVLVLQVLLRRDVRVLGIERLLYAEPLEGGDEDVPPRRRAG